MRLYSYLIEKTFIISKDVAYIWKEAFENFITSLKKSGYKKSKFPYVDSQIKNGNNVTLLTLGSSKLKSKEAKESHVLNPVIIKCGVYSNGSLYQPKKDNEKEGLIQISIHKSVLNLLFNEKQSMISQDIIEDFYQELNPERIKATIAHEISHWLNDTFHNYNISKTLDKARELNNVDIVKLGKKDVNMTHFEIDAQIHGIKQIKMQNKKNWDKLTLADLFFKYVSLKTIGGQIYQRYGGEVGDIWQKMLIKRLAREKLLGKNMKKFAKYPQDFRV